MADPTSMKNLVSTLKGIKTFSILLKEYKNKKNRKIRKHILFFSFENQEICFVREQIKNAVIIRKNH